MRRLPVVSAVSALAVVLLALPAGARAAGPDPGGTVKEPVAVGSGGAVASMDVDASQAGIDVLKQGGNAVDAAVATASALGVTIPFVAGPGGGGFMVIYLAKTHQVVTIDGRENCPAACTTTIFLDPKTGQPLDYAYAWVDRWPPACPRWWPPGAAAGDEPVRTPEPGRRGGGGGGAGDAARARIRVDQDFVQLTHADLPELQAYPASRALLLMPLGSRCRPGRCSATRTWPKRTGCWPAAAPLTCTTGPSARPSSRPTTTRCGPPGRPWSNCPAS